MLRTTLVRPAPHRRAAPRPLPARPAPLRARRRVLAVAAAAAALLLGQPGAAQAAPRTTLFGSSVQMEPGETYAAAQTRLDDQYGHLRVVRMFGQAPGDWTPSRWDRTFGDHNGVVSFEAPAADVLAGAYDDDFRSFFASAPRWRRTWWSYSHEPDVDFYQGRLTDLAQYRAAFAHIAELARDAHNNALRTTVVLVGWTANPASGVSVTDFWPGDDLTDTIAWDVYNSYALRDGWYGDTGPFERVRTASVAVGKPWGVAEFGSLLMPGDDGTGRAAWITASARYAYDNGAQFMCWFDSDQYGTGNDYRLHDEPSQQAWRAVVTNQSPYAPDPSGD